MRFDTVTMTAEKANDWLLGNVSNRNVIKKHVTNLRDAMINGEWKQNGVTLKVAENGRLLDGQHRLLAFIEATKINPDLEMDFAVIYDLEESAFETIDTGKVRSASDVLGINGAKYAGQTAAAIKMIKAYKENLNFRIFMSNVAALEFYKQHPELDDIAEKIHSLVKGGSKVCANSVLMMTYWVISRLYSKMQVDDFFERVITGQYLSSGDIELILRNKLLSLKMEQHRPSKKYLVSLIIRAWNAKVQKKEITRLVVHQSSPVPKVA